MTKMIFAFMAIFTMVFLGIQMFVDISGREKLKLAKITAYSLACASLSIGLVTTIIILF
jgi:hypothetical protein